MTRDVEKPNTCPDEVALDAFTLGTLDAAAADAVRKHVDGCAACRDALRDFHDSADFGRLLREWRAGVEPSTRKRLIDTATRFCRDTLADDGSGPASDS